MGTGGRDGDLQRLKANPPRNLHLKHRKPQPRPAWDRWLSTQGQIKPARGGCRLWGGGGGGVSFPENQKQLKHREGPGPAAARWQSDGFAFNCANPGFRKFYPPSHPAFPSASPHGRPTPRSPVFPPQHRRALSGVSRRERSRLILLGDAATVPGAPRDGEKLSRGWGGRGAEHPPRSASLL